MDETCWHKICLLKHQNKNNFAKSADSASWNINVFGIQIRKFSSKMFVNISKNISRETFLGTWRSWFKASKLQTLLTKDKSFFKHFCHTKKTLYHGLADFATQFTIWNPKRSNLNTVQVYCFCSGKAIYLCFLKLSEKNCFTFLFSTSLPFVTKRSYLYTFPVWIKHLLFKADINWMRCSVIKPRDFSRGEYSCKES